MEYARATARAMHEDHMAALTLLDRVDQFVMEQSADTPPDGTSLKPAWFLSDLKAAVHSEITEHFAFEEKALFPILEEAGADDMTGILKDEHKVLLPLGRRLADLADAAARDGFTGQSWTEFRGAAGEFVDRLEGAYRQGGDGSRSGPGGHSR